MASVRAGWRLPFALIAGMVLPAHLASASDLGSDAGASNGGQDPCHDFYQYACGTWLQSHPIPADRSAWDPYYDLGQKNAEIVRAILEQREPDKSADGRKIADDYASCMDEAAIERAGVAPLAAQLARIEALRTPAESVAALAALHTLSADALFNLYADTDFADSSRIIAALDLPGFGLPDREYYLATSDDSRKLRDAYRHHVARMLEYSGLATAEAAGAAETVLRLETSLAKVAPTKEQRRDPKSRNHKLTYAQLGSLTPSFPWQVYFRTIGAVPPVDFNVDAPDYLRAATQAWLKLRPEQQKAYLRWRLVDTLVAVLPAKFVEEDFQFYGKTLRGTKQVEARWKRCARVTNNHLGEAVGRLFVATHFTARDKERVVAMIRAIQTTLRDDIGALPWMTAATRTEAVAKLEAYRIKVGFPDNWRDYSGLEIRRGDAFGNAVRAARFEFARQLAKLGKPIDREEWFSLPQAVDGYQSAARVEVVLTAGFLQPPFFDSSADDAVNFGALGRAIGHELTHGLDDHGRKFDRRGNLRDWWTPADSAAFEERAQCFVDEYSQFVVVDDKKLNGRLTLGENIADNGGMRFAYAALVKRLADKPRTLVNGLTPEQRLFLAFAQTQCANVADATLRDRVLTDPHSPGRWRVNGTLANMPEFRQAFSCKPTDAMVNPRPCRIW